MDNFTEEALNGTCVLIEGLPNEGNEDNTDESDKSASIVNSRAEKDVTETSAPLVSCLQPTDLSQHVSNFHEDEILCVAQEKAVNRNLLKIKKVTRFQHSFQTTKTPTERTEKLR